MPRRVLFVCEGNLHRSPTAAHLYAATPGLKVRSAGLSSHARTQVTEELLEWADVVFVMDAALARRLRLLFADDLAGTEIIELDVPDDYQFRQPELLDLLRDRLTPHLGPPAD